jgi:hypothetical protein
MTPTPPRILNLKSRRIMTGPELVKEADKLRRRATKQEQWPYDWFAPPPQYTPREPWGSIVAPANATPTAVFDFQVPTGFDFVMVGILQVFIGSGLTPGAGSASWDLILNPSTEQLPIEDLSAITYPLGSLTAGMWWHFGAPHRFVSLDIIRSQVTTTNDITPGSPNFFLTRYIGFEYPSTGENPQE